MRAPADASAAIGVCRRRGLGRIRHLATADLWIQDRLKTGDFTLVKIPGEENAGDLLTKHVDRRTLDKHVAALHLRFEDVRPDSAPTLEHS